MSQSPIIVFDGVCHLCCGWVMLLIKLDKKARFKFTSLQSEVGKSTIKELGLSVNEMETLVFIKDKQYFVFSDAVLEILVSLGGIWILAKVFYLIPRLIRNFIYKQIAKRRYRFFGQRNSCLIPTQLLQKRFLE